MFQALNRKKARSNSFKNRKIFGRNPHVPAIQLYWTRGAAMRDECEQRQYQHPEIIANRL